MKSIPKYELFLRNLVSGKYFQQLKNPIVLGATFFENYYLVVIESDKKEVK